MGIHFPFVLLHNQDYPKVCPVSLNLFNAGDPFYRNIVVILLFSVFPDQGLNCLNLESSRVFSVNFLEPSLFQISELLEPIFYRITIIPLFLYTTHIPHNKHTFFTLNQVSIFLIA
jgi:hypothetical protein